MLRLGFGLDFKALLDDSALPRLQSLLEQRLAGQPPADDPTEALLHKARLLEALIAELFGLQASLQAYRGRDADFALLQTFKYKFVKRKAMLPADPAALSTYDPAPARALWGQLGLLDAQGRLDEVAFARQVQAWQKAADEPEARHRLQMATTYCAWAALDPGGRHEHAGSVLFAHARALEPEQLLEGLQSSRRVISIQPQRQHARDGFSLTDAGPAPAQGHDQAHYCLVCHRNGTDSCAKGMHDGAGKPRTNALGQALSGCPLHERISEFQQLRQEGLPIAALAMITRDNPMVAATGHRICNECSRACVFQQQSPVDIPGGETRILEDVLALPWGVEIYGLLMRWNPLRDQPLPLPDSGRRVLVAGLGPAGFTLAHHLLQQGHQVIAIDGQKIEPLPSGLCEQPVPSWQDFQEDLATRLPAGFGGVAEYGITARWNKNYLKLIRLMLERRARLRLLGGVRLGAQVDIAGALQAGFDHVALAWGAGKPLLWEHTGPLPRGVRMASDFLMALQLGGAQREDALAALQIELPLAVIGGGLTAVDTATEALAYYAVQVERFARRHRALESDPYSAGYLGALAPAERARAERFLAHGQAIIAERAQAGREGRPPNLHPLLQAWGGVTLIYRKALTQSPAYRLNHEELQKALDEGLQVRERCRVLGTVEDDERSLQALRLAQSGDDAIDPVEQIPVRTVLLALGTDRQVLDAQEAAPGLSGLPEAPGLDAIGGQAVADLRAAGFLPLPDPRISHYGDMHPAYAGSVVKAMASAADGARALARVLRPRPASERSGVESFETFASRLQSQWCARVLACQRLQPGIIEVQVGAPAAAARFQPGQFYKLQDLAVPLTAEAAGEPMAMTGAWRDAGQGVLATVVLQCGASTDRISQWQSGQPVVLMGPAGMPSQIPANASVLLVGGGLGNAVLFSIGQACRARGCRVTYIAGYRRAQDLFHREAIEAAADEVLWCFEEAAAPDPMRSQDRLVQGNVLQGLRLLADEGRLRQAGHLLVIGSDAMMAAVAQTLGGPLQHQCSPHLEAWASVNAPMQCMMKGICGQCLQAVRDPDTGQWRHVFACEAQDQPLMAIDFGQLKARLAQNRVLELQSRILQAHTPQARQGASQPTGEVR